MAETKELGGWYTNPATGKNQRWWGSFGWTNGTDPTGGKGGGTASAPVSSTNRVNSVTGSTSNAYMSNLAPDEDKMNTLSSSIATQTSGQPAWVESLRQALAQREGALGGLQSDAESKIKELYDADTRMASTYSNPSSDMYIENPMDRQTAVSGQKSDVRGQLGDIYKLISSRKLALGDALEKGTDLYKAGIAAQQAELDATEKSWSRNMEKNKFQYSMDQDKASKSTAAGTKASELKAKTDLQKLIYSLQTGDWKNSTARDPNAISSNPDEKGLYPWEPGYVAPVKSEQQLVSQYATQNPEYADLFWEALSATTKDLPDKYFGSSQSEVAAGVAGKEKTLELNAYYSKWLNDNVYDSGNTGNTFPTNPNVSTPAPAQSTGEVTQNDIDVAQAALNEATPANRYALYLSIIGRRKELADKLNWQ